MILRNPPCTWVKFGAGERLDQIQHCVTGLSKHNCFHPSLYFWYIKRTYIDMSMVDGRGFGSLARMALHLHYDRVCGTLQSDFEGIRVVLTRYGQRASYALH